MKITTRNVVALIVTAIVHIVVLIGLTRVQLNPPRVAPEYQTTWITIGSDKPKVEHVRKKLQQPSRAFRQIENETTAPPVQTAISSIDWRMQGEQAASNVAARGAAGDGTRSLSMPNGIQQQPTSKDTVGLFPAPLHKKGDTQHLGDGELITWVSDKCYATNRPFEAPQLDVNALHVVCKDPFKNKTDLFDHVKPKYLQVAPVKDIDQAAQRASAETAAPTCTYSTFRCK